MFWKNAEHQFPVLYILLLPFNTLAAVPFKKLEYETNDKHNKDNKNKYLGRLQNMIGIFHNNAAWDYGDDIPAIHDFYWWKGNDVLCSVKGELDDPGMSLG